MRTRPSPTRFPVERVAAGPAADLVVTAGSFTLPQSASCKSPSTLSGLERIAQRGEPSLPLHRKHDLSSGMRSCPFQHLVSEMGIGKS